MKTIYYLKFYIRGVAEPILYEVTKEESDRVEAELAYPSALAPSRFIEFETVTGRVVNVNPSYILMCWALFESQVRVPRIRVDEEEALAEREVERIARSLERTGSTLSVRNRYGRLLNVI